MILNLSSDGIITHTPQGIKYINQSGFRILNHSTQLIQDLQQDCYGEIDRIHASTNANKEVTDHRRLLQDKVLEVKFFETYSNDDILVPDSEKQRISLHQLIYDKDFKMDLSKMIFKVVPHVCEHHTQYFRLKLTQVDSQDHQYKIIHIQDQTINIMYNLCQGQQKILQLINACVSHEMRNPINSILATNLKLQMNSKELKQLLDRLESMEDMQEIRKLIKEMVETAESQEASTKLLNFYVGDLLCLA